MPNQKINIIRILYERKYFYLAGLIIGIIVGVINVLLGTEVVISEFICVPISCSFIFGFLLYLIIKEPERLKKEGRTIILSGEGIIHLALSFGSLLIIGLILKLINI